jgi:hypothetical protein
MKLLYKKTVLLFFEPRTDSSAMRLKPDNFYPVSDNELRELWLRYRDADVRRVILEVVRARGIMGKAHADACAAQHALWEHQDGNLKAAVQRVIDAMVAEKIRLGAMSGMIPHNYQK